MCRLDTSIACCAQGHGDHAGIGLTLRIQIPWVREPNCQIGLTPAPSARARLDNLNVHCHSIPPAPSRTFISERNATELDTRKGPRSKSKVVLSRLRSRMWTGVSPG